MKILLTAFYDTRLSGIALPIQKLTKQIPLTLAQLAAITPNNHKIYFDNVYNPNLKDIAKNYDLIAVSCCTTDAPYTYKFTDMFRKKGKTVVLGGYHPSALPKEAKQHADSVVIGEAELTWPQLLKDFENNNLKPFYRQKKPIDPNSILPASRILPKGYNAGGLIQATRGCSYRCEFCSIKNSEGYKYRKRPIENVIEEIKSIKSSLIMFTDASLTNDVEYTKGLFKEMKKLKKYFICAGNAGLFEYDEEMIKLSKEAGCIAWYIGFESISQESLDGIGKKNNKVTYYKKLIKNIKKHGVSVKGLFVFGFDEDRKDIFNKTLNFLKTSNIDMAQINVLTPFPGTKIYKRLEGEGRILTKDWSKYNFRDIVFEPKNMTKEELHDGTKKVIKNFFSYGNIFRRSLMPSNFVNYKIVKICGENLHDRKRSFY